MTIDRTLQDFIAVVPGGARLLGRAAAWRKAFRTMALARKPWEHLAHAWPGYLNVEVTNICNANCVFCAYRYQSKWRQGTGFMSDSIFRAAVDVHAQNGGTFVALAPTLGEPLIDPQLIPRVRHVLDKKMEVSFFTNGILLDRIDVEALINTGIKSIAISTAALGEAHFARVYRSSQYSHLLAGIRKLLETRNRLKADFCVYFAFRSDLPFRKTLATKDFRDQVWPLLTSTEKKMIVVTNRFDNWGGQITQADLPHGMWLSTSPPFKRRPCKWTLVPMVSWDGIVRLCACRFCGDELKNGDDLAIGDLREKDLRQIVMGDKAHDLRRRFVTGDLPSTCRKCTVYEPCGT